MITYTVLAIIFFALGFAVAKFFLKPPTRAITIWRSLFMYIVKDDNPDVNYSITLGEVKDGEGNVIPDAQLTVEVESDNPAAVAVSPGEGGRSGSISFGAPGQANVTANVKNSGGSLLGTGAASFTVTTGDPKSISGVSLAFEGLTES
jgi:hypothetical protein